MPYQNMARCRIASVASMPCHQSFGWKVDRLPSGAIKGGLLLFYAWSSNKILALHGSVPALLHDAHSLRSFSIFSVDRVASLSLWKQSLIPAFTSG